MNGAFDELHPVLKPKAIVEPKDDGNAKIVMAFRTDPVKLMKIGPLQVGTRTNLKCKVCGHTVVVSPASQKILEMGADLLCEVCADELAKRAPENIRAVQSVEHVVRLAEHNAKKSKKNEGN